MSKKPASGPAIPTSGPVSQYQPTPEECAASVALGERRKQRPPAPKLTIRKHVGKDGEAMILSLDHPDQSTGWTTLANSLGTVDDDFTDGLIGQLVNAGLDRDSYDAKGPNFLLATVKGVAPRDEVECMLAAQMGVTHMLAMKFGRGLAIADTIQRQDAAERAFTKLTRSFVAQMEGLKKYRSTGEQKIQVQHVVVNDGGQAVVGNVSVGPGGGDGAKKSETTP